MFTIYARHGEKYYRLRVSERWLDRHDNGALVSCGLTVGQDGFTERSLQALISRGQAEEVPFDVWSHSGCQSSCVMRGDATCRW